MKLTLRKSEWLDNWYVIERAEHDGREWLEPDGPNVMHFRKSSRIGNADIEGTAEEMREIARAIKSKTSASFKRCAAVYTTAGVRMSSPRNSIGATLVPHEDAIALAEEIEEKLKEVTLAPAGPIADGPTSGDGPGG